MRALRSRANDKVLGSREWQRNNQTWFRRAGGGASVALFVFLLALMPFVDEFRLVVLPDLCLSPVGERASVDIKQYSDVCE